ncbi:MAG: hypothetical protein DBY36_07565 [Clostridiales bacterium]|nr:MAG: hypothetical protein DBY36_07565 [Clostridiales bacterium]
MYRELIEACSQNIEWVRIQKPASAAQIQEAEEAVGCRFPAELKALLSELNGDRWLLFSTGEIMETTRSAREGLGECYAGIEKHLFFAGNGCGDYYCYNILPDGKADGGAVYLWEHETNETRRVAGNLAEMIERYYHDEI